MVNASPLILLARVGREDLLRALPRRVVVPRAVASEINAGPPDDPARRVLTRGELQIIDTPASSAEVLVWDLTVREALSRTVNEAW